MSMLGLGLGLEAVLGPSSGGGAPILNEDRILLLHFNGADGSTTITDSSDYAHEVTNYNFGGGLGVEIDTAQSVFGGASGKFDAGVGGMLSVAGANFDYGTGDLVIHGRARRNGGSERTILDMRGSSGSNKPNNIRVFLFDNFIILAAAGADRMFDDVISDTTWYHWAVVRLDGETRLFVDGAQIGGTYTDANDYQAPDQVYIGAVDGASGTRFNGHMDELVALKGDAATALATDWWDGFTPPASQET